MLIYIAGAGAMGSLFGYHLAKTNHELILLDNWQEQIRAIETKGLMVKEKELNPVKLKMMKPSQASEKADIVIVFTKAMQLEQMLKDIHQILSEKTKVICLLNGLGHERILRQFIDEKNIFIGMTLWSAALPAPGELKIIGQGSIKIQSLSEEAEASAKEIVALLNEAELNASYDQDVFQSIWIKACINGTMNPLSTLLDAPVGQLCQNQTIRDISAKIVEEFVLVAKTEGITINAKEIMEKIFNASMESSAHYPSMHQDLVQHHRLTEIEYLNGSIVKKGEAAGVDTPYCKLITELIHAKEALLLES